MSHRTPFLRPRAAFLLATTALASATLLAGCNTGKPQFAKVAGQVITQEEYVRALERQQITIAQGQTTSAERLVLDQLIGNRIILTEAAKLDAVPKEAEIEKVYEVQKTLWEAQLPGKKYEETMREQGATPADIKNDIKVTLAEANIFAKKLNISEADVREDYTRAKGAYGLPKRVQLRFILSAPSGGDFEKIKAALKSGKNFDEVAKTLNPPQLKATGGLEPQARPETQFAGVIQQKIGQTVEGKWFGPVDFALPQGQPAKAWVKVEKKLPALQIPYEDARLLVKRKIAQEKVLQPENAQVRQELIKRKMEVKFEAVNKEHNETWNKYKEQAKAAGIGGAPAGGAAPVAAAK